ncbi:FAD-dependent oxidoreductase [Conexibacter sp. JD483]|uniref:FAD-dependent oxidoreductase n=1 Tax=unclassified Conexibacter TaxID=2627773 RepID=UPI00271A9EA6|nr:MULTISPECIES: FAD-dependent oxidoreductase [unclassified Conexibacter]MDO8187117.1 FAD-dependent oxidoreductase [Conexibacter sp. CPCC 205706]MDO8200293.1 FAD-dependent oxidoreductase [Conexibacter sp. CPCC 205762]MDR9368911.1 FAD-dependent oxidoreductase [Conexibacter sp. JD483]
MPSAARVAVIGAGPAGFYASDFLLQAGFEVDVFDTLPTPFGLVRAGVAPDHPKIKRVTRAYERTARHPAFRFFGGVQLGVDVQREQLLERYHALVYAYGTATDNRLGIPGEDLPGSHAATEFVAWYNGHPGHADRDFDLSATRAVVIGNGNVAIDVARMLVLDPDEIAPTDTANHAIEALARAQVQEVVVLGRRGPAQAAFTNPELLELGELKRADVVVDRDEVELDEHSAAWLASDAADQTHRRNVEILWEYAGRPLAGKSHRVVLRFLRSPLAILGSSDEAVTGLRVGVNALEPDGRGGLRAVATGVEEQIDCGLVLRSIGYRGVEVPGVPFDARRGLIRNDGGRVIGDDGERATGEYAVGWIKRGPSGVIGTNKKDAHETVDLIVADRDAGRLGRPEPEVSDAAAVAQWLRERVPHLVSWDGWRTIDAHEQALGEPHSRPRVKLVRVPEMLDVAHGGVLPR